ncbi:MAG: AAA family ATPase [Polyangiales bacterium]
MKFLKLDFQKFGPFTNVVLDLSAKPRALHVIVGSNAVGKSTSLRAVTDLLYGIPSTSRDNHVHAHNDLRLAGHLASEVGAELELVRRKGRSKTLADPAGQPIDEALITKLVGGLARTQFEAMFGLSHEGLVEGGNALLAGAGDVGESLFSAGLGGRGIHHLLKRIEDRADGIFKPGGQNPPLNKAIAAFKDAKKSAQDASVPTKEWEGLHEQLREHRAQAAAIDTTLRTLRSEQRRFQRIRAALAPVAQRDVIEQQLVEHRDVVELPELAAEERRAAEKALNDATTSASQSQDELKELEAQVARLNVPTDLLARADSMKRLGLELGGHLKAASDLPRRRADLRVLETDADTILRELASDVPLAESETLRIAASVETRMTTLAKQRGKLEVAQASAKEAHAAIMNKLEAQRRKLASLSPPVNVAPLRRVSVLARQEGDLEKRSREHDTACKANDAALSRAHSSLGLWVGPTDAIGSLPVPAQASVDRFDALLTRHANELAKEAAHVVERRAKLAQLAVQLDALERSHAVPTEEELARTRGERDDTWRTVRRAWLGGETTPMQANALSGAPLAIKFEGDTRGADDVADRLRREADRVATFATLRSQRDAELRELGEAEERHKVLEASRTRDTEAWRALWSPIGIEPLSPREMGQWLQRYAKLADDRARCADTIRSAADLRAQIAAHVVALGAQLAAFGEPLPASGESLAALVARAEDFVVNADALATAHAALTTSIDALDVEAATAGTTIDTQVAALKKWELEWAGVTSVLQLPGGALSEEAEKVVERRKALFAKADEAAKMRHRVSTIEDDARAFATLVDELVRTTASDLSDLSVEQRAEALQARFVAGSEARVERDQLEKRRKMTAAALAASARKHLDAEQELGRLMAQAQCENLAALAEAERRSALVRDLRRRAEELDTRLLDLSDSFGIAALRAECADQNADDVSARLVALESQLAGADEARKVPEQAIGKVEARIDEMNGGDRAAVAAESAQQALASIRTHVDEYARARLASVLLREEIARYRAQNQGPLVRRASELFRALTVGTFAALEADYDEKEHAVMRCVRADDRRVDVEGLSEGTRDQLFLALRIASMERHLDGNEPVPVIVDDALINFDDERARAALRILGELARRTQVLFFTHHRHLADLAEEAVPEELRVRHDLDRLARPTVAIAS